MTRVGGDGRACGPRLDACTRPTYRTAAQQVGIIGRMVCASIRRSPCARVPRQAAAQSALKRWWHSSSCCSRSHHRSEVDAKGMAAAAVSVLVRIDFSGCVLTDHECRSTIHHVLPPPKAGSALPPAFAPAFLFTAGGRPAAASFDLANLAAAALLGARDPPPLFAAPAC